MPPLPGLGGSAILPQAQAPATLPQLFLPTGITSERVTFPEGHCHAGGGSCRRQYPGCLSGCETAVSRLFWWWRQPVKRLLEGLLVA